MTIPFELGSAVRIVGQKVDQHRNVNVEKLTLSLGLCDLEHGLEEHEALQRQPQLCLVSRVIEIPAQSHRDDLRCCGLEVGHTVLNVSLSKMQE